MAKLNVTDQIIENLLVLSDQLRFLARRQSAEHGLSILQTRILHYLDKHPGDHATSIRADFQITNATFSEALKSLRRKKLVQVYRDKSDGRKAQLELTEWGKKIAQVTLLYTKPVKNIIEPLKKEEQNIFLKNIQGIILKLKETLEE